jgi:hypothetical protein
MGQGVALERSPCGPEMGLERGPGIGQEMRTKEGVVSLLEEEINNQRGPALGIERKGRQNQTKVPGKGPY